MFLQPQGIKGSWKSGIVLDWHTMNSEYAGENEFGYPIYNTTRTELGELMYQYKYQGNQDALNKIILEACQHLTKKAKGFFDLLIPIPPSKKYRSVTQQLARHLSQCLEADFNDTALCKKINTQEIKSLTTIEEKTKVLKEAFSININEIENKKILLIDDLYDSGATLEAVTQTVLSQTNTVQIYVLAITRTRRSI